MTHVGYKYSVEWHSPYTQPPDGQPRVMVEMFESIEQRKARMDNGEMSTPEVINALHRIGDGYCIVSQAVCMPIKQMNKDSLAIIRQKRIKRRIQKKYPLFAEEFIQQEIAKKPDYYLGETCQDLEEGYKQAIDEEEQLYQRYLKAIGGER